MPHYIKAEPAPDHTVIYTDDTGKYFRFSGGSWAWRNHNPGNLVPGKISAQNNQIGRTKKFAIFPDYESGHSALIDCLKITYENATIDYLVQKFAPAEDGNDVVKYTKFLRDKTGVYDDKKVKNFTPDAFDKLWKAIEQIEGYKEGSIIEVPPVIQVHKNQQGISNYNIKTQGWFSKTECVKLAKQGLLDLVICSSPQGHDYLRARKGSSVNGSLNKLVVKNPDKKKSLLTTFNKEKIDVAI